MDIVSLRKGFFDSLAISFEYIKAIAIGKG
jgi:hypothetical protein